MCHVTIHCCCEHAVCSKQRVNSTGENTRLHEILSKHLLKQRKIKAFERGQCVGYQLGRPII
jgi:hypothetical protein